MNRHRQAALSVIEGIRSNPNMTAGHGVAIVEAVFPGKGATYLGWYGEWWYKFAVTDATTWAGLKARVAGMGEEHYQLAKGKIARMVAELAALRDSLIAERLEASCEALDRLLEDD